MGRRLQKFKENRFYYFQRLIQYGGLVIVIIIFMDNYNYGISLAEVIGLIAVGTLMIYWHKNTRR